MGVEEAIDALARQHDRLERRLAEVEAERDAARQALTDAERERDEARAAGAAEERAKIVAWLDAEIAKFEARMVQRGEDDISMRAIADYGGVADAIERLDHHRDLEGT